MKLSIVRGTSGAWGLSLTKDGNPFTLETGQVLVFGLKKRPEHESCVLVKKITHSANGEYYLELTPADTAELEHGTYFYDIGLQHGESIFYNVIESSEFKIKANITKLGDAL